MGNYYTININTFSIFLAFCLIIKVTVKNCNINFKSRFLRYRTEQRLTLYYMSATLSLPVLNPDYGGHFEERHKL